MPKPWSEAEYALTDDAYAEALEARARGMPVRRADLVRRCQAATGREADGSVNMHLGNLTSARAELGLPVLPEVGALENHPLKLTRFLRARYAR